MSQQNWAKILSYLYNEQETVEFLAGETISEDDNVVSDTGLDTSTIKSELNEMDDLDLVDVEYKPTDYYTEDEERIKTETVAYSLSKKGFDVAHERELVDRQDSTNTLLVMLTFILAGSTMVQAITSILSHDGATQTYLSIIGAVIFILVLVGIMKLDSS